MFLIMASETSAPAQPHPYKAVLRLVPSKCDFVVRACAGARPIMVGLTGDATVPVGAKGHTVGVPRCIMRYLELKGKPYCLSGDQTDAEVRAEVALMEHARWQLNAFYRAGCTAATIDDLDVARLHGGHSRLTVALIAKVLPELATLPGMDAYGGAGGRRLPVVVSGVLAKSNAIYQDLLQLLRADGDVPPKLLGKVEFVREVDLGANAKRKDAGGSSASSASSSDDEGDMMMRAAAAAALRDVLRDSDGPRGDGRRDSSPSPCATQ
jgi:hypothetical protein